MTNLFLFKPTNIDSPQWSAEELEKTYGPIQLYSFNSAAIWAGVGGFGEIIDLRYDGYGLSQGTNDGAVTGFAGYLNGEAAFSADRFNIPISEIVNFTPGLPISQLGIFDNNDYMVGSYGGDVITGYRGSDEIYGLNGNDIIRGGSGNDTISGGSGQDILYGGDGRNTFMSELDGYGDYLYIRRENNQDSKADLITSLDAIDRIIIQGASTNDLSFEGINGSIGIFTGGSLAAVYTGYNLTTGQLSEMTTGMPI